MLSTGAPIIIEDDVFIGMQSLILKGVTIGRGSVIGAGSVVTRDVPPGVVVAGNPAAVVKRLASDQLSIVNGELVTVNGLIGGTVRAPNMV